MTNFRIIFIHGYTGSSRVDWYPNISKELTKLDIDYAIPDLPGGLHPHAEEWLEVLHKEIVKSNKPLVLVGHSLGTRTVLLYLEKYLPKVVKVFLIAAFANRVENSERKAMKDFFTHKIDLIKIISLVGKFIVTHSKDDTEIDYAQGVEIAKDLGAKFISTQGRNHFDLPFNTPFILRQIRDELQF